MPKKKVKIKQKARVRKKKGGNDSIPKVEGRPPASNAPTLRVKVRKK